MKISSKKNSTKKKNTRKLIKKKLNLKSVVESNELTSSIDKTDLSNDLVNEMYKPSLKPLKSRVNNHKIKSIKVNESTSKNVLLDKIDEYDDKMNEQLENDNKMNDQSENDDLVIDDFEEQKYNENNTTVEFPKFVDQLIEINEDQIDLVPKPSNEEIFNIDNFNNELSNLDNNLDDKDKNLIDNKMFYKELFRLIQKGKNLEKYSKSRDTLKSINSLNKKELEKRFEKKIFNSTNNELIKIDKITNNYKNKLDQNMKDNLDSIKSLSDQLDEAKIQTNSFIEKMDDSNQLTENSNKNSLNQIINQTNNIKDQINQIDSSDQMNNLMDNLNQLNNSIKVDNFYKPDHLDSNQITTSNKVDDSYNNQMEDSNQINYQMQDSNQLDDQDHITQIDDSNENSTFNPINFAILTGLLSAFFYYYNNFT